MQQRNVVFSFLLFFGSIALSSCNENGGGNAGFSLFKGDYLDVEAFQAKMIGNYTTATTFDSTFRVLKNKDIATSVNYAYQLHDNQPFWMDDNGVAAYADQLLSQLTVLQVEGVGDKSQISEATDIVNFLKAEKSIPLDTLIAMDQALTHIYMAAANELLMGTDFNKIDNQWFVENDSIFYGPEALVQAVKNKEAVISFDTFRSNIKEYTLIHTEIKHLKTIADDASLLSLKSGVHAGMNDSVLQILITKETKDFEADVADSIQGTAALIHTYQQFYNLKTTGKLDEATLLQLKKKPAEYISKLEVNLNRLRRLPRELGTQYVWVNIPLMELEYMKASNVLFHSRVIVGKPARATPSISSPMTNVVFNPPWGVPPTILKNDVGPGVARAGGGYLARKGLRAYDNRGRDVTSQVNGSNYKKYFISQPPGAGNALGEVKFNMPNKEAIYIHDTPHRGNFGNANRALSSGCVRTENPKQFAEIILGTDSFSLTSIDKIISTRRTRSKVLDEKIPVYIIYLTVAPTKNGKGIRYLNDIYGRDKKMMEAKQS